MNSILDTHVEAYISERRIKKHNIILRKTKRYGEYYNPKYSHIEICDKKGKVEDGEVRFL